MNDVEEIPRPSTAWRTVLWILLPLYLIASAYLLFLGESGGVIIRFGYGLFLALLVWLTNRLTRPPASEPQAGPMNRPLLAAQLAALLLFMVLTGLNSDAVPVWSSMVAWFHYLGESVLSVAWFGGPGNAVANPVQYFVFPFILLLLLGARPSELGLGPGTKVWRASLLWLAVPVVAGLALLATGSVTAQTLARRIIGNSFQNGFFEEFLFRGALLTRLRKLFSVPWTLTIQALLFGLWHLRGNTLSMDGNLVAGLALCLVSQAVAGFAFGYLFHRTGNLVAPSVAHVGMNVLGQSFG